jgi:acetylornithine deacetylase/succinyl-diaminopimelate desuccinylase-like protein
VITIGRGEASTAQLAELALALVACPSPNPPGDERAVVGVLRSFLATCDGVELSFFEPAPQRQTLVATAGAGSPCLMLAAHTDTHAVGSGWTVNPLGESSPDGRLYGRGTTDNKGAVAAMATAFASLAGTHHEHGRLLFVANADEETGGLDGAGALSRSWSERPDGAIVAEASGVDRPWERLWIGARGTSRFTIRTEGTSTHSSLAGRTNVRSAVELLQKLLNEFRDRLPVLANQHPIFGAGNRLTVVRIQGGEGWGTVPGRATAACELRLLPGVDQTHIETEVSSAFEAARLSVNATAALEFAAGGLRWMDPSQADPESEIVKAASAAWAEVVGSPAQLDCFPGATDARLFEQAGIPCVVLGPGALSRAHHADEFVTTDELSTAYRLYRSVAARFLGWEG